MKETITMGELRQYAEGERSTDPVYWGEVLRVMDREFVRPDDKKYREWLLRLSPFTEEQAWSLTDEHVSKTRDRHTECYPVVFGATIPMRTATPRLADAVRRGHLLLGFVTTKEGGPHLDDLDGYEPTQIVDEVFVLPCWDKEEVEPILRGCFLYA